MSRQTRLTDLAARFVIKRRVAAQQIKTEEEAGFHKEYQRLFVSLLMLTSM